MHLSLFTEIYRDHDLRYILSKNMAKGYVINSSCLYFRTFTKGRRPGIKNLRPDSAPPGKFDGQNRSRVSGGEPHPMMAYYNSPQIQRYASTRN